MAGEGALLDSNKAFKEAHPIDLNALVQPYLGPIVVAFAVAILLLLRARRCCWRAGSVGWAAG